MLYFQQPERYKLAFVFCAICCVSGCGKLGAICDTVQGLEVDKVIFYRLLRVSYILQGRLDQWLFKMFAKLKVFIEE